MKTIPLRNGAAPASPGRAIFPLWQSGFRPFFLLAAVSGVVLPLLWILVLRGVYAPALPALPGLSVLQWHAHEMFFGFGGAVLIGFLLTASRNWVGSVGYQGRWLIALVLLWLAERLAVNAGTWLAPGLFWVLALAFPAVAAVLLCATLIRHRASDSFAADNRFFLLALPLLLPAKVLLLWPESFGHGLSLTLAIFRLAFLLMLERTVRAFMRAGFQREIPLRPPLDFAIKLLALFLCAASWWPPLVAAAVELALAALLFWRLQGWLPQLALRRLDIGIMHIGYAALALQLLLDALALLDVAAVSRSLALHVFTLGAMGAIVPAMFIRIASGHTGRPIVFGRLEHGILWLALLAALARTLGPLLWPAATLHWLEITATAWALLFGLWLQRYGPRLWQARADARV